MIQLLQDRTDLGISAPLPVTVGEAKHELIWAKHQEERAEAEV